MDTLPKDFFKGTFYVVTPLSIYQIITGGLWYGVTAEKIASHGPNDSSRPKVGQPLYGGIFLAITRNGILKYGGYTFTGPFQQPGKKAPSIDLIPRQRRGNCSDIVVALFLNRQQAFACHKSADKVGFDPRWEEATREAFHTIGREHPFIGFSEHGPEAVIPLIPPPILRVVI